MPLHSPRRLCLLAVLLAGLTFAACGGDDEEESGSGSGSSAQTETSSGGSGSGGGETEVEFEATESGGLGFDPKQASAKPGNVTLTMTNPSGNSQPHAIAIEGGGVDEDGQTVQPGSDTSTVTADLKAGEYQFYCPVGQHRQAGMEGTLTVR